MRAIVFANGILSHPVMLRAGDVVIAADGGARHCLKLGITPQVVIGDFDSLTEDELASLESAGAQVIRHPARKDFTDLELALQHAGSCGVEEILVYAALGDRWDQTVANLLLPAAPGLEGVHIRIVDGPQEILLLRPGPPCEICGQMGDTVSLIPLRGDITGVVTTGLEYPLKGETLYFGATRGISNILLGDLAAVQFAAGLLLCIVIHSIQDR